jgi:spore coat protein U-like protein
LIPDRKLHHEGIEWSYQLKTVLIVIITLSIFITPGIGYAADSNVVSVTATVISRGYCQFTTTTSALNFGNLDPSSPVDITSNTSISFQCFGFFTPVTYYIDDNGLNDTGNAHRMKHISATEYLPYSLTLNPRSSTIPWWPWGVVHPVTITGTVRGVDYQDARVGNYQDTVTISIVP